MDKKAATTIEEYIRSQDKSVQPILRKIRSIIKKAAPKAEETIAYGMPTFKMGKNLIHFAAFKNHIGLFPTPSGVKAFASELKKYPQSKGGIQFPIDKPIPFPVISKITKFRVAEVKAKVENTRK